MFVWSLDKSGLMNEVNESVQCLYLCDTNVICCESLPVVSANTLDNCVG